MSNDSIILEVEVNVDTINYVKQYIISKRKKPELIYHIENSIINDIPYNKTSNSDNKYKTKLPKITKIIETQEELKDFKNFDGNGYILPELN